jgi:PucR family transcriptional regulator, purine catabolism regulatory protein
MRARPVAIRRGRSASVGPPALTRRPAQHADSGAGRTNVVPLPGRRRRSTHVPTDALTVREMLGLDAMRGARIIAGADGLDRLVRRMNVMTVPNIVRWTKQDEFLLTTGYPLPRQPAEFCQLIEQLAANGLAGLGVKLDEYLAEVPAAAVQLADQAAFPIVVIPAASPLDDVLSQTFETIVNRQATALARRQQIHDAFLRVALTGGGLARLSDELAELLPGADVVICDPAGYQLAATTRSGDQRAQDVRDADGRVDTSRLVTGMHEDAGSGTYGVAAVIRAGDMRYVFVLAIGGTRGLPAVAGLAVEQAALVAALEVSRDLAVLAVEQQFASNALHDLVTGTAADMDHALARAVRFGWDLQRPLAVLVARSCSTDRSDQPARQQEAAALRAVELWMSAIRDRDRNAAVAGFATELVAVVGAGDAAALARKVHADMTASTGRAYSVGVSQVAAEPQDIPRLYEEARVALQVGLRLSGSGAVTSFAELGLYRLISNVSQAELRAFVNDTLGLVLELPEPARTDLLRSLAVLSSTRFNVAESARILHYHYNTMRYRVTKLERLLGDFANDGAAELRIGVALQILRMYEISGDSLQTLL